MRYKHGRPLIESNLFFRLACHCTFYPLLSVAQTINVVMYLTHYEGRHILFRCRRLYRNAVLVSNHTTFLDPVKMAAAVFPLLSWHTLLEATVEAPYLGTWVRLLGGVPVPRGRDGLKTLFGSTKLLFKYRPFLHFYPEGECYLYNQKIQPFKPGAFKIAAEANVPVIPMVSVFSEGPFKAWTPLGRSLPIEKLVILEPVFPADYVKRDEKGEMDSDSLKAFAQAVREKMQRAIDERGGTQAFFRGHMKRMKGINA